MIHPWMQGLIIVVEEKKDHETHERNADGTFVVEGQNEAVQKKAEEAAEEAVEETVAEEAVAEEAVAEEAVVKKKLPKQ